MAKRARLVANTSGAGGFTAPLVVRTATPVARSNAVALTMLAGSSEQYYQLGKIVHYNARYIWDNTGSPGGAGATLRLVMPLTVTAASIPVFTMSYWENLTVGALWTVGCRGNAGDDEVFAIGKRDNNTIVNLNQTAHLGNATLTIEINGWFETV